MISCSGVKHTSLKIMLLFSFFLANSVCPETAATKMLISDTLQCYADTKLTALPHLTGCYMC